MNIRPEDYEAVLRERNDLRRERDASVAAEAETQHRLAVVSSRLKAVEAELRAATWGMAEALRLLTWLDDQSTDVLIRAGLKDALSKLPGGRSS